MWNMCTGMKEIKWCVLVATSTYWSVADIEIFKGGFYFESWGQKSGASGMGDAATQLYKRLANLSSVKHSLQFKSYEWWWDDLQCKLSFSLLRPAIMCIRGPKSSWVAEAPIVFQVAEAHI